MEVDHIFIFSNNKGKEANDLVEFGLTEGSSRLHPGQGTTNRKFYFDNFFLEILWVVNEEEIRSELTAKTKLWERSQFKKNGNSRFGLCLVNSELTDKLFEKSEIYEPDYFPKDMSIDIITNEQNPDLPWTFRLPYRGIKKENNEPIEHLNGIKSLTKVEFETQKDSEKAGFKDAFKNVENVRFTESDGLNLILEFDNNAQGKIKEFSGLNLTVKY
ncbi:VOC family protein [Costertonia aggregata]|uniref:VOC family protein n=1 Tax=Costertonia aggregata TaxID=343403 RepID=A0A7H9AP99_9FLAO|nr:VOC family protein [Costertonia aggregata]QLG45289.1 VOC family protein [Costertonia aggregata]